MNNRPKVIAFQEFLENIRGQGDRLGNRYFHAFHPDLVVGQYLVHECQAPPLSTEGTRTNLCKGRKLIETFDIENAVGSVDLISSQRIIAHATISNLGGGGTFGQGVPAVPAEWGLGDDEAPGLEPNADIAYLFSIVENDEFRTNVGVSNLAGVTLEVDLEAFDGTSPVGAPIRLIIPPYSHIQVNRVLDVLGISETASPLRLNVSAAPGSTARFLAYSSRVDNVTGDAVFLLGEREPPL